MIGFPRFIPLVALALWASSMSLRSQESTPQEMLPKESFATFGKHANEVYDSSMKIAADLSLSNQDERVLLHLSRRGFPWLARLLDDELMSAAGSTLFMPDNKLKTCSREEDIAGELLTKAIGNRVVANRYVCFHLVEKLAPSAEAMQLDKQAKELTEKMGSSSNSWTECSFLETLESVRALFDRSKDLPQMTTEEYANEREESAVLTRSEYEDSSAGSVPPDTRKWLDQQLDRQKKRGNEGYLMAYGECSGPHDYERFQMVIKPKGDIFEANQSYSGSHFHPDFYESKLPTSELQALTAFLAGMPPSDAAGTDIHFIVSFSKDGNWVTRTYTALPAGNPLQPLLKRMIMQSRGGWTADPAEKIELLAPQP